MNCVHHVDGEQTCLSLELIWHVAVEHEPDFEGELGSHGPQIGLSSSHLALSLIEIEVLLLIFTDETIPRVLRVLIVARRATLYELHAI
jgi:hypothetical protein